MNFSIYIKKYRPKITFVLAFFFSLLSSYALGQKVAIEDVIQKDQQVHVYYALEGNSVYEVTLYFIHDEGGNDWTRAQIVSGDVGEKQKGGVTTKLIVWDVIADIGELVGKCDFMVTALDTKAQKKKNRNNKKINSEFYASENSLSWLYSGNLPLGFSYSKLQKHTGGYIDIAYGGQFPSTLWDINNYGTTDAPGYAYRTGNEKNGYFKISAGITKKFRYPIWIYAGLAYNYHKVSQEVDRYFSTGSYWMLDWMSNTDQSSHKISPEFGLHHKLGNLSLRTGVIFTLNDGFAAQIGIGILVD